MPYAGLKPIHAVRRPRPQPSRPQAYGGLDGRVKPGNLVMVTVDALDQRQLPGRVRSVSLELRKNADGDDHYPTIVDLELPPPDVRVGITVRVAFVEWCGDPRPPA